MPFGAGAGSRRVAAPLGSHCDWDGDGGGAAGGHLRCALTSALGLGAQCETAHRAFVQSWFGDAIPARCHKVPITEFSQEILGALTVSSSGDRITIVYDGHGTSGPGERSWAWTDKLTFQVRDGKTLTLVATAHKGDRPRP